MILPVFIVGPNENCGVRSGINILKPHCIIQADLYLSGFIRLRALKLAVTRLSFSVRCVHDGPKTQAVVSKIR